MCCSLYISFVFPSFHLSLFLFSFVSCPPPAAPPLLPLLFLCSSILSLTSLCPFLLLHSFLLFTPLFIFPFSQYFSFVFFLLYLFIYFSEEAIVFLENPNPEHGIRIEGGRVETTGSGFYSLFLEKEMNEGIYRVEVVWVEGFDFSLLCSFLVIFHF
jgi:hypothetical protein